MERLRNTRETYTKVKRFNVKGGYNMATAQSRASAKYDKAHTKGIYLKLNKETDADIINFLSLHAGSNQGLIKELLREYMTKAYSENFFKPENFNKFMNR
jgi:hypothetical protein